MNHIARELTKTIDDNLQRIVNTEMTQTTKRPKKKKIGESVQECTKGMM